MKYEPIEFESKAAAEAAIVRNAPAELLYVPLQASMDADNCTWAEDVCVRLAVHPDPNVRGNAVEGFSHLARRFGVLDRTRIEPLLRAALADSDPWVRAKAEDATRDIAHFLGWRPTGEA